MRKVSTAGGSLVVTLPRRFLDGLGIRRGDALVCGVVDGAIVLRKVDPNKLLLPAGDVAGVRGGAKR